MLSGAFVQFRHISNLERSYPDSVAALLRGRRLWDECRSGYLVLFMAISVSLNRSLSTTR